jgi:hypothetical protein
MKSLNLGILACCAFGITAGAMADETSPGVLTGRIEHTYVRLEPGVFRETTQPRRYAEIWVEVRTDRLEEIRSGSSVHMIRADHNVERGDIVTFLIADGTMIPISPMPREARIVAVVLKQGTNALLATAVLH